MTAQAGKPTAHRQPGYRRVLVAGLSEGSTCGVRDHAEVLGRALGGQGFAVDTLWIERGADGGSVSELGRQVSRRCRAEGADVVLFHYSVFAYSRRGVPLGVPLLALRLVRLGVPVVLVAHELAYPWGRRGWRGTAHAMAQRAALVPLVAASRATVVTTPDRVRWMETRRWLPRRPVAQAPVFSNIRPDPALGAGLSTPGRIGLFSYGSDGLAVDLVTAAVARVARARPPAHLALIGAPGSDSAAGRLWSAAAQRHGCPLVFTEVGTPQEVSRHLAGCRVLVFADRVGPSSRKGSLAAALAHGKAVVALDGPQTWPDLVAAGAVAVVDPDQWALEAELRRLLDDEGSCVEMGRRGAAFAEENLSVEGVAETIGETIEEVLTAASPARRPGRLLRFAYQSGGSPARAAARAPVKAALLSAAVVRSRSKPLGRALANAWWWQVVRRTVGRPVVIELLGRCPFLIPAWSECGGMVLAAGSHEPAETDLLDRLMRAGDVFVDVGANIGLYSILAATRGLEVVAFEPATRAAASIAASARLAGVDGRVRIESCALSDAGGTGWFVEAGDVGNHLGPAGEGREVEVQPLDRFGASIGRPDAGGITILKIDVEGSDLGVLEGARRFLAERHPVVMIEAWDGGGAVRSALESRGFRTFAPGTSGLAPLPREFWQANILAVMPTQLALVEERLLDRAPRRPAPPRVLRWRGP